MTAEHETARRRWSARQRLVVLTFDTVESAIEWDDHPARVKPWLSLPLTWDAATMGVLGAARDVIDEWDVETDRDRLPELIERLRRAVHDASQVGRLRVVKS